MIQVRWYTGYSIIYNQFSFKWSISSQMKKETSYEICYSVDICEVKHYLCSLLLKLINTADLSSSATLQGVS